MSTTAIIWGAVVVVLMVATWDIENPWKRWCLLILITLSVTALRVVESVEGYRDGYRDGAKSGACAVYTGLDNDESVTVKDLPEHCP